MCGQIGRFDTDLVLTTAGAKHDRCLANTMRAAVWRELAGDGTRCWRAHLVEHDVATQVPESSGPIGAAKRLVDLIAIREQAAAATGGDPLEELPPAPLDVAARWQRGIPLLVAGVELELRLDD